MKCLLLMRKSGATFVANAMSIVGFVAPACGAMQWHGGACSPEPWENGRHGTGELTLDHPQNFHLKNRDGPHHSCRVIKMGVTAHLRIGSPTTLPLKRGTGLAPDPRSRTYPATKYEFCEFPFATGTRLVLFVKFVNFKR
jgi:hypothetical protein